MITETRGTAVLLTQSGIDIDVVVFEQGYVAPPPAVRAAFASPGRWAARNSGIGSLDAAELGLRLLVG
ncbi:hypothetical protein [Streptomyces sp. Tu6071]|uniref:hypothetical protein n=1 Tax=Streptomyces sp. Tu6071 TaxID=355249 RepID=UPI0018F89F17|nr:hypothetical protein [Streptomyces sp. Tu6071]